MVFEPFEASFNYNGKTLTRDNLILRVSTCEIEDVDFEVPEEYAYLLLHEGTKTNAWNFLKELSESSVKKDICTNLLKKACGKGFSHPRRILRRFNLESLNGKPRFYAELDYEWKAYPHYLTLTNGEEGYKFYANFVENLTLSPNVYCNPEHTGLTLNAERFSLLIGHEKELFSFIKKMSQVGDYAKHETKEKCFTQFFENEAKAYKTLKQIIKIANHRKRRDKLYETLKKKGVLEFQSGFFVSGYKHTFYVSRDGDVYDLEYKKGADEREAVLRVIEKGTLPTKMSPVEDGDVLREVAKAIGRVKPELAIVILP